jgi:hypothetical protein
LFPHVSFFAAKEIEIGEELCFSYASMDANHSAEHENETKVDYPNFERVMCYCGATNCLNYLPNDVF